MAFFPRRVLILAFWASFAMSASAQQSMLASSPAPVNDPSGQGNMDAVFGSGGSGVHPQVAPSVTGNVWFLRHYAIGSYSSPLGFGGRVAVSLTHSINLRAGASYFSYTTNRTQDGIPYTVDIYLQSEQAGLDWYPFHNSSFHVSPGALFAVSNHASGSSSIPAGTSFTLNNETYYSGTAGPVQASGYVNFRRVGPTLTLGWGNWIRHEQQRHWLFPFEFGVAFMGDPNTALNFSGIACYDPAQHFCTNIATNPEIQANVEVERKRLQNDADWARFYPIIAGGIVYRF